MLYMYLAANADGFNLALSPVAVRQATGMPRSTYQDQFIKLIDKGYLVQESGNKYNFYETPQPSHANIQSAITTQTPNDGLNFEECPPDVSCVDRAVPNVPTKEIEINNREFSINNNEINNSVLNGAENIYIPKEKIIKIPVPKAERKKEFIF